MKNNMRKLVIIGAGGHGKVVADIAIKTGYKDVCFLDDAPIKECMGLPVEGGVLDVDKYLIDCEFFIAIGNAKTRKKIYNVLKEKGAKVITLVHPNAVIGSQVKIGNGCVVMAGGIINACATLGDGVIVNTNSSIDHDCTVGDFCHLAVGVNIAGTVEIGESCFLGAGCTVKNNVNICNNCIIGAGAVVVKDIVESGTYVGVPCKLMRGLL